MRRQRVVRHDKLACDIAGGQSLRLVLHQQTKYLQPRRLRQRGKRKDDFSQIPYVETYRHVED